jgi:hypothetical protein
VFTLNQNDCSRSIRIGVHVEPEWVFMMDQNMHTGTDENAKQLINDLMNGFSIGWGKVQ